MRAVNTLRCRRSCCLCLLRVVLVLKRIRKCIVFTCFTWCAMLRLSKLAPHDRGCFRRECSICPPPLPSISHNIMHLLLLSAHHTRFITHTLTRISSACSHVSLLDAWSDILTTPPSPAPAPALVHLAFHDAAAIAAAVSSIENVRASRPFPCGCSCNPNPFAAPAAPWPRAVGARSRCRRQTAKGGG